ILDPYQGFIRGNMFNDLYNSYKFDKPVEIVPKNEQAEILTTIDALGFAMGDLNLYLDIYSNDSKAIELYNYYKNSLNEYMKKYEEKYGPLTLDGDALTQTPWSWIKSPWPWEENK
ncbi:MAG TPA: spore coat protein CotJB, partial [Bacilli bacterium]|nr:spore coat protein CotJB [Bacilli bacterium]